MQWLLQFLGIVVGTLPITVPGLPQTVRLGLAGGSPIVALVSCGR